MKFKEFLTSKGISDEQFTSKSAEDMAGLYNEFNEVSRKALEKAIENKASKEDIETLKETISANQAEQMKSLNETLKQYGLAIKKLTEAEKSEMPTANSLRKSLEENVAKLRALKGDDKEAVKSGEFTIKAAGTMLISANVSGGNASVEQRIAGMNAVASRQVRLIDLDLVVASQAVVKRTAYIKVSTEMMDDIDFIESEINNELMRELLKDVETTSYSGNGTAPALNGVRTVATAFAAGDFALAVDNANEVDVLVVAMNQIAIANQPAPDAILMHPTDVTKLKLAKVTSSDKRYIERLQMIGGSLSCDGVPIIPTTLVTAGQYLVGNFKLATLYTKSAMNIQVGLDGNDFTKNLRTIIAEWRGALVVKNNDRTAFVKGVFATDKAALETA